MKKLLLVLASSLAFAIATKAQTDEKPWNIGFHGGIIQYNGDIGNAWYQSNQATYGFGGVSVSRYLLKNLDASAFLTRGETGYINSKVPSNGHPNNFLYRHNTANILLRFNFLGPRYIVRPFIFVGTGVMWFEKVFALKNERFEYSLPTAGGGLNIAMGPVVGLHLQETFMFSTVDDLDHVNAGPENDMFLYHSAGLTFNLGKKKDVDMDGIRDSKDQCPNTPPGVSVDDKGCPFDKDADGILDYQDACPDVAGAQSLKGCPDRDIDGIADSEDRCPESFGTTELKGCPDNDKDGVADLDDKCAGTKTGYKVDVTGCTLDNDKDGVINEDDKCPDVAGVAAMQGCADGDGDGISDLQDHCPTAKGSNENKGCPEIPKVDIKNITLIAGKIYFETGSAKLKLISNSALDDLADILSRNEGVSLTIEGHTDNVGDDTYNLDLSQQRTESVKAYLMSKGIDPGRLTAVGYGETAPISDNASAAGKAKNRRVELKTSY